MTRRRRSLLLTLLACPMVFAPRVARADDAACIAASEEALSLDKAGKLHDALKQSASCADPTCPAEITAECARRIDIINGEMPTLILSAKDPSGNDLFDVTVTMDGAPLLSGLNGRSLSIDPGEHSFVLTTAGQPSIEKKYVLRSGEKDRVETVVIGTPLAPVVTPPPPATDSAFPPPAPSSWSAQKSLAIGSGVIGVVGLGVGVIFGSYASSSQSREKTDCPTAGCTNYGQGLEDYNTAKTDATVSTISFIAGGVFLAGGIVLWLTAPKHTTSVTAVAAKHEGLSIVPSFLTSGGGIMLRGSL